MSRKRVKHEPRPENDGTTWAAQDDVTLLDLMARHLPKESMAMVLKRTKRSVDQRLSTFHREAWRASGHPESAVVSQPHNADGPLKGALERHRALEEKLDRLTAMVETLLREMCGPNTLNSEELRPNGRAHG